MIYLKEGTMRLRDIADSPCGIRHSIETLPVSSGFSMSCLLDTPLMDSKDDILEEYAAIRRYLPFSDKDNASVLGLLRHRLSQLKDIRRTITDLKNNTPLDDISFFEIKSLAILVTGVADILLSQSMEEDGLCLEDMEHVLSVLDPDGLKALSFHVYNSYSEELSDIRRRMAGVTDPQIREGLLLEEMRMEDEIRKELQDTLLPFGDSMMKALIELAHIDILVAKGAQIREQSLCFPELYDGGKMSFTSMFHPEIKSLLEKDGKEFTDIDLSFDHLPTVIIGANMGGKTVVLKTVALCQYLMQSAMGIPAGKAVMDTVDRIFLISGDAQNIRSGLSSFAAEMKSIDEAFRACTDPGCRMLVLVDEPARSTNPVEGTALVEALLDIMCRDNVFLLITTHYNLSHIQCRRLKVKGYENGKMNYRLGSAPLGTVPMEAMRVAEEIGISPQWIGEAKKILNDEKQIRN